MFTAPDEHICHTSFSLHIMSILPGNKAAEHLMVTDQFKERERVRARVCVCAYMYYCMCVYACVGACEVAGFSRVD